MLGHVKKRKSNTNEVNYNDIKKNRFKRRVASKVQILHFGTMTTRVVLYVTDDYNKIKT